MNSTTNINYCVTFFKVDEASLSKFQQNFFMETFKKMQGAKKANLTHNKAGVLTLPDIQACIIDIE